MPDPRPGRGRFGRRVRVLAAVAVALLVLGPLAWMWQASLTGSHYSVASMGYPDYGGHPEESMAGMSHGMPGMSAMPNGQRPIDVRTLTPDPNKTADVKVDLVARQSDLVISGQTIPGYTLNDTSPGPTIAAAVGQLVEVHVHNASVQGGMTLHWHGVDVPNAEDGTAGVTQDDIPVGGDFTYRFVPDRAGTFWYHSHQLADPQVAGGLFGPLVITPADTTGAGSGASKPVLATFHSYGGLRTLNGRTGDQYVPADPGAQVRVRVINTDNGPIPLWSAFPYTVAAVDGTDLNGPTPVTGQYTTLTAGGRADIVMTAPADGGSVRLQVSSSNAVLIGGTRTPSALTPQPSAELDLLHYGSPAALPFDPTTADRHFDYRIGKRPGFVHGKPGIYFSINSHLYPNVPMYMVHEGDLVIMTISNSSGEVHPMHLHGHRAVVLSRNGVAGTGSPWWVDSLNVRDGETYQIAFKADNPGIWMDHCHNLSHAALGMVAHLMYVGYSTPYEIGGPANNQPE